MKKLFSIVFVAGLSFCTATSTWAQDAKQILQKVSTKYNSNKAIKGSFSLKFIDAKGTPVTTQNGTFALKGNKYRVSIPGQDIITDGKSTWTYRKSDKEVQVDNYNANTTMSPAKLLSGSYEKDYNYKYVSETTVNGKKAYLLELIPKAAQKDFTKIHMYVDKANNGVLGGKVYEKTGSVIEYTLSNVNDNANVPESEFTFDAKKHPGVEVIDLR